MKRALAILLWGVGLAILITLIVRQGLAEIFGAVAEVGWGLLAVTAFYVLVLAADTRCWQHLFPAAVRPRLRTLLWIRWICGAVNGLLPVAQVGGDFVRTRLVTQRGVPGSVVGASVVVDITVSVLTQLVFSVPGILILLRYQDGNGSSPLWAIGSVLLFAGLIAGFYFAQHSGLFHKLTVVLEKTIRVGSWSAITGGARALDEQVVAIYRRRRDLLVAAVWRLIGWVVGTGEVWLALHFLGHPVTLVEAFMLESMGQAIRNAAFMVPGALGVQDGGLMLLGSVIGLDPTTGLALSMVKRVRELALGIPALIVWQAIEWRRLGVCVAEDCDTDS